MAAKPTGVHRVASELINGLDAHLAHSSSTDNEAARDWRLLKPRDAYQDINLKVIAARTVGINTWQPWEQIDLPIAARGDLLINLCNLAPLVHPNCVTMIHDAQVFSSPESYSAPFRAWYRFALPKIGAQARRILTVSEYSRTQLATYGIAPYENIRVIHNGIDHMAGSPANSTIVERLGLMKGRYVLALANRQRHKNVTLLLQAFSDKRLSPYKLVLVGRDTAAEFNEVDLLPTDNTVFAGAVSDAEFRGLMESAGCFAFPSLTEGFGLPPLEAMSLGCPAVVSPCGALPEVCGSGATYASEVAPSEWVSVILKLTEDEVYRRQMVAAGLTQSERFTWSKSAAALAEVINDVPV